MVPGNIFVLGCSAVSSKPVLYIYIYIYIFFFLLRGLLFYISSLENGATFTAYFSNSLKIHEVNYQPQDVYHITCMCLDTQWKTAAYHSRWRVVYTTKICTMTTCKKSMHIYYSQVTLLSQCFIILFKPINKNIYLTIIKLDIWYSKIEKFTNLTKRKKRSSVKDNNTHKYFTRTKFYPPKCNLPAVGHERVQCSTSIYIRKVALHSPNDWVQRTGRIAFPRRVAYFLNEPWQPAVPTAWRHICKGRVQSLYSFFEVSRGKKASRFQSTGLH